METHASNALMTRGGAPPALPVQMKYCLYARKSMEQEDKQALSIESQVKEMLELAEREQLEIVEIKRESHSSKEVGQRPIYNELIAEIKQGKFNGILTWAPDRLSRNAGDLGAVVDLMDQQLLHEIRTYGQKFTNNPNEKFLLMILGSQAKLENDNKMVNVKRGLRARCEMGLWPAVAPTGYLNHPDRNKKCEVIVDEIRSEAVKQMFEKVAYNGWSGRKIYHWLKDDIRFTTRNGKPLTLSNVYIILKSTFYYGEFEYPKGSGNWYKGKHDPIITKDLYNQVQSKLTSDHTVRKLNKEFAFTKMITCGLCGSGVTADEKFKKLKDGTENRYVYYGCTKFNDKHCPCGYIREEDLIEQLANILDTISLDEIGMKDRIKAEIQSHNEFQESVLGEKSSKIKVKEIDIRNYAKHILRKRPMYEKRELLSNLRSKLVLSDKQITIRQ
ncbi:MAG: recombinase family protein [Candidatus Pacebacteria bacterium]|nr:recombinase family protein [Candidatus Paceibacterota bacterium]